jgi:hypothetical protein
MYLSIYFFFFWWDYGLNSGLNEDHSLKPAWANSLGNPILKTPNTKQDGGVAQAVRAPV